MGFSTHEKIKCQGVGGINKRGGCRNYLNCGKSRWRFQILKFEFWFGFVHDRVTYAYPIAYHASNLSTETNKDIFG